MLNCDSQDLGLKKGFLENLKDPLQLCKRKTRPTPDHNMLYKLFQSAQSESEFDELLRLTFTENERAMMIERWKIFDAFDQGMSQREVSKEVPCSIVTATRGAKVYRENKTVIQRFLETWRKE
jgi:Trp operon repressor